MAKRILSFFMALCIMSMLFTGIPARVSAANDHRHKICIESVCGDISVAEDNSCGHGEETYEQWYYTSFSLLYHTIT